MPDLALTFLIESWLVLGQMAAYLLAGFLVAGVLSVCISPDWVERHLGRRGVRPVFAASLFGVPLPLCSCGVIPVAASIRQHGASRAATSAFLLSTPQTGVDSIAVTYALLGPVFAVFRPIAALVTGVVGGLLVQWFGEHDNVDRDAANGAEPACTDDCCQGEKHGNAVVRALHYSFVILPRDIGPALLLGILIAGAMGTLVPEKQLESYLGAGFLSILLMMGAGVPVYVCATASVPIAAGLMHMGASPGAALAFLIAGPATNAAALTTIWRLLGRRTAMIYLLTVAASAIGGGLLINCIIPAAEGVPPQADPNEHGHAGGGWLTCTSAVVLLIVVAYARWRRPGPPADASPHTEDTETEQRLELRITGMRCSHCSQAVRRALLESPGVATAEVDLSDGRAVITGKDLDPQQLAAAVSGLGYAAEIPATSGSQPISESPE